MANEEVTITVNTEADTSSLEALETMLDEITMTAEGLGDSISEGLNGVDSSGVQETGEAANDAAGGLEDMAGAAGDAAAGVDGINPDNVKEVGSNATGAADDMEAMGSAAAAVGAGAALDNMVDTAGNIQDSWNRLGLTFGTVTESMKQDMSTAQADTGRSGATVRDYFNMMGIAGVKNSGLLKSSFESLAGRAYQTGQDVGTLENAVQRMVLTGNAGTRQLKTLGITTEDLGRAMGVSGDQAKDAFDKLSQEDRLKVLSQAMGDGSKANSEYKNSWAGMKEQAGAAMAGLMGAVGTPILSVLIPAMRGATNAIKILTGGFNSLPGPLQTVIGVVGGASVGFFAFIASLAMIGKVLNGVKSGLATMNSILQITNTATNAGTVAESGNTGATAANTGAKSANTGATGANTAATNYNNLSLWENIKALFANISSRIQQITSIIASTVQHIINTIQTIANTIVKWLNTIATYALAIAEWLLAAPIILIVVVVIAAIAVFLYLYNSNEMVRNGVNGLIAAFWNFLVAVGSAIMGAVGYIVSLPGRAWAALMQTLNRVLQFGGQFLAHMRSAALRGVLGFISSIASLPGKLAGELSRTLNNVISWGSQIVAKFGGVAQQAWQAFIGGLGIGSPGYISILTDTELNRVSDSADAYGSIYKRKFEVLGQTVSGAYTNGNSTITTNLPSNTGNGNGVSSAGGNITINIQGDVLNDKLVDKMVKELTRVLKFNNTTAGRTIGDMSL